MLKITWNVLKNLNNLPLDWRRSTSLNDEHKRYRPLAVFWVSSYQSLRFKEKLVNFKLKKGVKFHVSSCQVKKDFLVLVHNFPLQLARNLLLNLVESKRFSAFSCDWWFTCVEFANDFNNFYHLNAARE